MPIDTPLVTGAQLTDAIRRIVAEVLVVPLAEVLPESVLVDELGAESIDFLDIIFNLEEVIGRSIPQSHWQRYLERRFEGGDLRGTITTTVVREFAEQEAARPAA